MSHEVPEVEEDSGYNLLTSIWIVPIIAVIIAIWLAVQYFTQLGPRIEIVFENNEGLKEGQSQIKYRDIAIGKVEKVVLREDGEGVKVIARIDKEAVSFLSDDSKFWIVKPEVGIGGITGLDTIISGTYINMYSTKGSLSKKKFIGLEQPYRPFEEGSYFHLNAPSSYNIVKGTPVYYKNINAGKVEHVSLALDGTTIDIIVYIEKLYVPYIHTDSNFWVQSAIDLEYSNGRFDFNVAPVSNLIRGGIEFSSSGEDSKRKVPDRYIFRLYKSQTFAQDKRIGKGGNFVQKYLLEFNTSIAKLSKDAVVLYDGFEVGRVTDIRLGYDKKSHQIKSKVFITIDTSIFYDPSDTNVSGEENLEQAVTEGLAASIESQDPISGLMFINLVFDESNRTKALVKTDQYILFPSIEKESSNIMNGISGLIASIEKLPLDKLVRSTDNAVNTLNDTIKGNQENINKLIAEMSGMLANVNKLVDSKEFGQIPEELNKTMRELQKSLKSFDQLVKGDKSSLLSSQLTETLREVAKASLDTQKLLKKLDRKPNSLIFGD